MKRASFPIEAALKREQVTINVTSELSLVQLLDMVRSQGAVRLAHGDDVLVITRPTDRLPDDARNFLKGGGVIDSD